MSITHEKILVAAKDLFSTKGYAATTTKDIAAKAQVSEVTLFRHFKSKRNLFYEALHNSMQADILINFYEKEIQYDLQKDLEKLSNYLYSIYKDNGQMIKMMMKDAHEDNANKIKKPSEKIHFECLGKEYFIKMHEMGKIADDPIMSMKFFYSNAKGFLMRKFVFSGTDDDLEYYKWMIAKTINAIKK